MKTDLIELLGVCCLALFAFAIWPPACLLVFGVFALIAAYNLAPQSPKSGSDL